MFPPFLVLRDQWCPTIHQWGEAVCYGKRGTTCPQRQHWNTGGRHGSSPILTFLSLGLRNPDPCGFSPQPSHSLFFHIPSLASSTSLRTPSLFVLLRGPENPNVSCAFKHARCWQLVLQLWLPRNLFVPADPWLHSLTFKFIWGLHLSI